MIARQYQLRTFIVCTHIAQCPYNCFFFWLSHFVMLVETGLLLVLILWCIFRNRQHRSNYMKIIRQSRSVTCTCTRINVSVSVNYIPRIIYTQIWWKDQMLEHSSVWLLVTMMATWMSMLKVDLSLACMQSEMLTRIDWLQIKMYISFTNEWPVSGQFFFCMNVFCVWRFFFSSWLVIMKRI